MAPIDIKLFNDTNGEHLGVFTNMEPFLGEIAGRLWRSIPGYLENWWMRRGRPPARGEMRERMKNMRAAMSQSQTQTATRG